jgi:hypothetical protein
VKDIQRRKRSKDELMISGKSILEAVYEFEHEKARNIELAAPRLVVAGVCVVGGNNGWVSNGSCPRHW